MSLVINVRISRYYTKWNWVFKGVVYHGFENVQNTENTPFGVKIVYCPTFLDMLLISLTGKGAVLRSGASVLGVVLVKTAPLCWFAKSKQLHLFHYTCSNSYVHRSSQSKENWCIWVWCSRAKWVSLSWLIFSLLSS